MKLSSLKGLSLLGLVLATASVVTAAVMPTKKAPLGQYFANDPNTGPLSTCTNVGAAQQCDVSAGAEEPTSGVDGTTN